MTFAADSVSATPFRGGSATLNPPLGHSKAREEEKFLYVSCGSSIKLSKAKHRHSIPCKNLDKTQRKFSLILEKNGAICYTII